MSNNPPIIVDEHSKAVVNKDTFTDEEISIIETKFRDKIEIVSKRSNDEIRTREYVGYIVLRNNVIVIKPKIPGIGFLNMLRYALELPELGISPPYDLEEDITVHIILFDLEAENEDAFKYKCDDFMDEIRKILNSLNDKKPRG